MFSNFRDRKGNYELVKVLNEIKEGKFDKEIAQLREAGSEEEKGRIKNSLLAFPVPQTSTCLRLFFFAK